MPAVFWFDPACEEQVALGRPGFTPGRLPRLLAEDLETLPFFLAGPDDVVLLRRQPRSCFLNQLRAAGFAVPGWVDLPGGRIDVPARARVLALVQSGSSEAGTQIQALPELARGRRPAAVAHSRSPEERGSAKSLLLQPWGWSPQTSSLLAPLASLDGVVGLSCWTDSLSRLYSKAFSVEVLHNFLAGRHETWLCGSEAVGAVCTDVLQVSDRLKRCLQQTSTTQAVIKAQYGQAGRHQLLVTTPCLQPPQRSWLGRVLQTHGAVVVEPWLDRVKDLSLHVDVEPEGTSRLRGWVRFLTDRRGQFRGVVIAGQPPALGQTAPAGIPPQSFRSLMVDLAEHVGRSFRGTGFQGPAGIDMLVYRDRGHGRLKPVVEINPRFTMGRLGLHLAGHLAPGCAALWVLLGMRDIRAAGFQSAPALVGCLQKRLPWQRSGQGIERGVLATTDPERAQAFVSLLIAASGVSTCARLLAAHPPLDQYVPAC